MCGIAGYFGTRDLDDFKIESTLELMKRRGPDGQGVCKFNFKNRISYLLHSRLSIIDIEKRSDQPFSYNGKTIIFNGEIYNYLEIRNELVIAGHQFNTNSDTEVLLHAIDEWGVSKALNNLEGMWAFVLYDHLTGDLTLSRDPFGEKPLYYYKSNEGDLFFGSEIKYISELRGEQFKINSNHICRFLVNGYKSLYKTNEKFFQDIQSVPPANLLIFNNSGSIRKIQYWKPYFKIEDSMLFEDAVVGVRERLIGSLERKLRSDTPIAFCMSGGIDSNTLISIARRIFNYEVHGFSIINKDPRYEENDMIQSCVKELKVNHYAREITSENFLSSLRELVKYHDAPVATITMYLNWILHQEINLNGFKVSISGTASDEIFSGYYDHHLMYLYDIRNEKTLFNESVENWKNNVAKIVRNPFLNSSNRFINDPFFRKHIFMKHDVYESYLVDEWHEYFKETLYCEGLLKNRMINEIFEETTPVFLHEDDLNAMYYSIENRTPFLDRELLKFTASIPTKHFIRHGEAKAILRAAMRGIVPDIILDNKRKVGLNAPITDLLDLDDENTRSYLLSDSPIYEIVRKESILNMLDMKNYPNSDSKFLFSFLSSKIFMEEFI